jgi:putative endonuclease
MVRCSDDSLYTGYATDLEKRLREHNGEGKGLGAKYTRGRRPVEMIYSRYFLSRSRAMREEAAIKQLTKTEKLELVESSKK